MSTRSRGVIGVLAVIAVLATGCGGDGDSESTPPAATSPTASESTAPAGPVAWVDELPIGPPPAIGYVIAHTYHSPDGRIVRLPRDRGITAIARLGDGYLMVDDRGWEGSAGISRLDNRGRRVSDVSTVADAPVLSNDGATLRWITFTPAEVGPYGREPTRLHVADVATGEIESRVIPHDVNTLPQLPRTEGRPAVYTHLRGRLVVVDDVTEERLARLDSPGGWIRRLATSAEWEDRRHLLVSFARGDRAAAILRVDLRTGDWSLAVDWTPMENTYYVTFETTP